MTPPRRLVVVGARGFIARTLVPALAMRFPGAELNALSSAELDLTEAGSYQRFAAHLDDETVVVVCAGLTRQHGDDLATFSANVAIATSISRALAARPPHRVIYLSSAAVYGEEVHNLAIDESTPQRATSYYGLAKLASEWLIARACRDNGRTTCLMVRPPLVYGPAEESPGYGPGGFVSAALLGQTITLWGDGTELRDFIYVDDLVEILGRLVQSNATGVLNVATGSSTSFVALLDMVRRLSPAPPRIEARPRTKAKVDNVFDTTALMRLFPGLSLALPYEGMAKLVESWSLP